jgi:hypothetical protein
MDRTDRSLMNGANASLSLDCPWCAEPLRGSLDELADGLVCPACLVEVALLEPTTEGTTRIVEPIAA